MIRTLLVSASLAWPAFAGPAEDAEAAAAALAAAGDALAAAESSRDRVSALTDVVAAYEAGLAALRDGIRRAALRESAIRIEFESEEERLSALLGALLSMQTSPETLSLLHPAGPVDSARAAMIMSDVTPAISARTSDLKARLEELEALRIIQENAAITLQKGLTGVQEARTRLSQAISNREPPPDAGSTDMATLQALVFSADTLEGFAADLASTGGSGPAGTDMTAGPFRLPVQGVILRGFNEPDAEGIRRPGLSVATAPRALVTAPFPSTLRYAGPLLDLGKVAILEPMPGTLVLLIGLAETFGAVGDVLSEGAPLGLMGGEDPTADQILIETGAGTGQDRPETLYIEIRQGQSPVDPAGWFELAQEQDGRE